MLTSYNRRHQGQGASQPHSWKDLVETRSVELVLDGIVADYQSLTASAKASMQWELQVRRVICC